MIKLSNQQIAALTNKIIEELTAPINEHNQKVYDSQEYKNFYDTDTDCLLYKQLDAKYNLNYPDSDLRKIRQSAFKHQLKSTDHISRYQIESEIVLATIDASDLQTLIETVSKKFQS